MLDDGSCKLLVVMEENGGVLLNLFYMVNTSYLLLVEYTCKTKPDEISTASHLKNSASVLYKKYFGFKNIQDYPIF